MSIDRKMRTSGSALTQVFGQIGPDSPDIEDFKLLNAAAEATQTLIERERILSGHGRSDGGLATALLEMAFAGTRSVDVKPSALFLKRRFRPTTKLDSSSRTLSVVSR